MRHPALDGGDPNAGTRPCNSSERWLLLLVGAVASLQAGCAAAESTGPIVTTENGVSIVASPAPQWGDDGRWAISAEPTLEIGVESGAPEYMLAGVRAAISLDDGRIALANAGTYEVRLYQPDGIHSSSFGRQGQGPAEFEYVWTILDCVPDELWVLVLPYPRAAEPGVLSRGHRHVSRLRAFLLGRSEVRIELRAGYLNNHEVESRSYESFRGCRYYRLSAPVRG